MKHKSISWAVVIMAISLTALYAQSDSDFEILQNPDNTVSITGYKGSKVHVNVPPALYGLKVTRINEFAFLNKGIKSVTLPATLKVIGDAAFSTDGRSDETANSISEIIIPDNVDTIGQKAFSNNLLRKVTFGRGLKYIGNGAFSENEIEEIVLPNSVKWIGGEAFQYNRIKKITFEHGLEVIGNMAFYKNNLTELTLPATVKEIWSQAFSENQLHTIILPKGIDIASSAFMNNNLRTATLPDGVRISGRIFQNNPMTQLVILGSVDVNTGGVGFGYGTIFEGLSLTRITMSANISDYFFKYSGLEANFVNFYKNQNRAAKTYYKAGPIWTIDAALGERFAAEQAAAAEAERIKAEQAAEVEKAKQAAEEAAEKRVIDAQAAQTAEAVRETAAKAESANKKEVQGELVDGKLKDPRDGKTYSVIKINKQTWMAENLNYNGTKLYDWNTAKKACPGGWHLPAASEWHAMGVYLTPGMNKYSEYAPAMYDKLNGQFFTQDNDYWKDTWWSFDEVTVKKGESKNAHVIRARASQGSGGLWDKSTMDKSKQCSVRCIQGDSPPPRPRF